MFGLSRKLDVASLTVAEFRTRHLTAETQEWIRKTKVPYAESCSRQIIYGFQEDFKTFPLQRDVKMLQGGDGYANLLELVCGLKSKKTGETHIRNQFFEKWNKYAQKDPIRAKEYRPVVSQIDADSKYVIEKILSDHQVHTHVHAARDLSGLEIGDKALIIPDITKHENLSGFSANLLKICESKQNKNKYGSYVTVTHPNIEALHIIKKNIMLMKEQKILRSDIAFSEFSNLSRLLEDHDKTYIDLAMSKYPEADQSIIESWKGKLNTKNFLVHLKGSPDEMGSSIEAWRNAGLENYASPEDLREEMIRRGRHNKDVVERGLAVIQICADLRVKGEVPSMVLPKEAGADYSSFMPEAVL